MIPYIIHHYLPKHNVRGILLIPQIAAAIHGSQLANLSLESYSNPALTAQLSTLGSPIVSPFSSSPGTCAPFARVSNFNVLIGNKPYLTQNVNYGWELFNNEILKCNTAFGNAIQGMSSGLLDKISWEKNHGCIYVDLSRWESLSQDNAEKNVGVSFTNACNITERMITVNTSTGQLIL